MPIKLIQVQRKLNIGINTIVEFLEKNGHKIDSNPNTRISDEQYALLAKNFREDIPNKESWHSIKWNDENRSLIIALKTKPFIILSGISGTGKSSKVASIARSFCSGDFQYPPNYELIPVKPNWFDSTELLGYISPSTNKYISTSFTAFINKALEDTNTPYFVCLDEMNLAHVEQYFAEILSIIETKTFNKDQYEAKELSIGNDSKIRYPLNLYIIGTVNMDDTTFSFSRKVLDRAMVFENNNIDLHLGLNIQNKNTNPEKYNPEILLRHNLNYLDAYKKIKERNVIIEFLTLCNNCLDSSPFKFAYRLRNEVILYCYYNSLTTEKPTNWLIECLDEIVLIKLLPRIEGDRSRTEKPLKDVKELLIKYNLNKSIKKIDEMIYKLDSFEYTSYWY